MTPLNLHSLAIANSMKEREVSFLPREHNKARIYYDWNHADYIQLSITRRKVRSRKTPTQQQHQPLQEQSPGRRMAMSELTPCGNRQTRITTKSEWDAPADSDWDQLFNELLQ